MALKYKDNSDFFIGRDENITDIRLNKSMTRLIENDFSLSPLKDTEPKIWECRWFSDNNVQGYGKGYAVWINTEDVEEFLNSKSDNIYDYIKNNPLFTQAEKYNPKSRESVELYTSLLSGYYDEQSGRTLQPVYYIGQISAKAQIKISLKDNNKDTPDTLSSWRDYFIRDTKWIEDELSDYSDYLFEQHIQECHFDGQDVDTDEYADITLSNVSGIERYKSNIYGKTVNGFDFIESQERHYSDITLSTEKSVSVYRYGYTLSAFEYDLILSSVHRDIPELKLRMGGTRNYDNDRIGMAIDTLSNNENGYLVDINFRMSDPNANNESFPWVVSYEQWDNISGIISAYDSTFTLTTLLSTLCSDTEQSIDYYKQRHQTTYYSDWSTEVSAPYPEMSCYYMDGDLSSQQISTIQSIGTHRVLSGYNCWKSGYVEQFGCVKCPHGRNTKVHLQISGEYTREAIDGFYGIYTRMGDLQYDGTGNLGKDDRYQIQLTPIYNGDISSDGLVEVNTILNDGFSIYNQSQTDMYYMYNTRGYISRSV